MTRKFGWFAIFFLFAVIFVPACIFCPDCMVFFSPSTCHGMFVVLLLSGCSVCGVRVRKMLAASTGSLFQSARQSVQRMRVPAVMPPGPGLATEARLSASTSHSHAEAAVTNAAAKVAASDQRHPAGGLVTRTLQIADSTTAQSPPPPSRLRHCGPRDPDVCWKKRGVDVPNLDFLNRDEEKLSETSTRKGALLAKRGSSV